MNNITIINRHYPPNPGITGESAWDLAKYLIDNHQTNPIIIHIARNDLGGGMLRQPIGKTYSVKTIYKGEQKKMKMLAGFFDGFSLIFKALFVAKGPIIVMTSPPMLPFWASFLFKLFNIKWILWSMDLFPEGFAAAKKIKKFSIFYRSLIKFNYLHSPQKIITLGENQGKYLMEKFNKEIETIFLPCGVLTNHYNVVTKPIWRKEDNKIYLGYCGNLGEAHSDEFLNGIIDNLNPELHHLILAIYGTKSTKILKYIEGKKGITVLKNVPRPELHFIDIHLASLLPEWTHVAVPSKVMSTIAAGASFLFFGDKDSDSWQINKEAGWLIDAKSDMDLQIKNFFENLTNSAIDLKKDQAKLISKALNEQLLKGYLAISKLLD